MRERLAIHAREIHGIGAERIARESCIKLGVLFESVTAISRGRNSGAFTVSSASGEFILKTYQQSAPDALARFVRELNFLTWANSQVRCGVPTILAASLPSRWIAMEKLQGNVPKEVGDQHLLCAAGFVGEIADAKISVFRRSIRAKDGLWKGLMISNHLRQRVKGIQKSLSPRFSLQELLPFAYPILVSYPGPHLDDDVEVLRSYLSRDETQWTKQTIFSPSDFGFHNSVEKTTGGTFELRFFDFEYAGLDHPMKLMMDFALQPDYLLSDRQIALFFDALHSRFFVSVDGIPSAVWRLFVFKWALIITRIILRQHISAGPPVTGGPQKLQKYLERFGGWF